MGDKQSFLKSRYVYSPSAYTLLIPLLVVGIPHDPSKLTFSLPIPFTTRTLVGGTFPMTFINRPIVQRSWGLFEYQNIVSPSREADRIRYGADFQYEEFIVMPSRIQAFVFSVGYMLTMLTLLITPVSFLSLPSPSLSSHSRQDS